MGRLVDVEQFADMILKTDATGGAGPRARRGPDRAGGAGLRPDVHARRQVVGRACRSISCPAPTRSTCRKPSRTRCKNSKPAFRPASTTRSFTTRPRSSTNRSAKSFITLRDAVILVAVVVLLFLQNWRSAIIPLVAVPVAIVGTFAVMAAMGFSLNNLTLFGLVLAIGIVVDDAIVVVEAVEQQIEHGLPPREATIRAMEMVSGPVIAVGLVLSAVFIPCTFITGITGQFFRQFALTIAVSTAISAFNSLTLSPALTALLLRTHGQRDRPAPAVVWLPADWRPLGLGSVDALWLGRHARIGCRSLLPSPLGIAAGALFGRPANRHPRPRLPRVQSRLRSHGRRLHPRRRRTAPRQRHRPGGLWRPAWF